MLTTVFTPNSQENLSGYLTGPMDEDGRPRLTELTLPARSAWCSVPPR